MYEYCLGLKSCVMCMCVFNMAVIAQRQEKLDIASHCWICFPSFFSKYLLHTRPLYLTLFFSSHFMDLLASRILYITEALRLLPTTSMVLDLISFNNLNQSTLLKLKTILMLSEKAWIGTKVADSILYGLIATLLGGVILFLVVQIMFEIDTHRVTWQSDENCILTIEMHNWWIK